MGHFQFLHPAPHPFLSSTGMQLVFSDACWVGTLEENPEEKRLPMPPHLQHPEQAKPAAIDAADTARLVHTHFDYAYGAGPKPGTPGDPASTRGTGGSCCFPEGSTSGCSADNMKE